MSLYQGLLKSSVLQTLMIASSSVCALISYAVMGRSYGPETLGQALFWIAVARIYLSATDFGAVVILRRDLATVGAIGKRRQYKAAFQMRFLSLAVGLGLTAGFFLTTLSRGFERSIALSVYSYIGMRSLLDLGVVLSIAKFDFVWPAALVVATEIICAAVLAGFAHFGVPVANAYWWCCAVAVTGTWAILRVSWLRYGYRLHLRPDWNGMYLMVRRGFAAGAYVLCLMILQKFDSTLLGLLSGRSAVALYGASANIATGARLLPSAIGQGSTPTVSRAFSRSDPNISRLLGLIYVTTLASGIGVALVCYLMAGSIVTLIFGDQFRGAISCLKILAVAIPFGYFNIVSWSVCVAIHRDRLPSLVIAGGALINIALNVALIPRFHQDGAAAAACTTEIIVTCAYVLMLLGYARSFRHRTLGTIQGVDPLSVR